MTNILVFCGGFALGLLIAGIMAFRRMARRAADLEKWQRKMANGMAHSLAIQQTVYGEELDAKSQEFTRTRQMTNRDMGIESDLIDGSGLRTP